MTIIIQATDDGDKSWGRATRQCSIRKSGWGSNYIKHANKTDIAILLGTALYIFDLTICITLIVFILHRLTLRGGGLTILWRSSLIGVDSQ